jgi:hypothetical protein
LTFADYQFSNFELFAHNGSRCQLGVYWILSGDDVIIRNFEFY